MELSKIEVASRQLDTAIKLFFNAGDIVSVHTLAAASANVFADILDNMGETSWRKQIIEEHDGKLTEKQVKDILREAQNFFKHADRDPDKTFEFPETYNDHVMLIATLEERLLLKNSDNKRTLSIPGIVFQTWYMARKPDQYMVSEPISDAINKMFPGLNELPRFEQLSRGATVLKTLEAENVIAKQNHQKVL